MLATLNRQPSWTPVSWKRSKNLALLTNSTVARAKPIQFSESNLKSKIVKYLLCGFLSSFFAISVAQAQPQNLMLGYSGSGISSDLRRVMEKDRIWEKHGLSVKSIYFNS